MDKEKLVKLLNLSASSEDGEALSAIRFANTMLKKSNKNWDFLLSISSGRGDTYSSNAELRRTHQINQEMDRKITELNSRIKQLKDEIYQLRNPVKEGKYYQKDWTDESVPKYEKGPEQKREKPPKPENAFGEASVMQMIIYLKSEPIFTEYLNGKEREFIISVSQQYFMYRKLSYAQNKWLTDIYRKN